MLGEAEGFYGVGEISFEHESQDQTSVKISSRWEAKRLLVKIFEVVYKKIGMRQLEDYLQASIRGRASEHVTGLSSFALHKLYEAGVPYIVSLRAHTQ